MPESHARVVVLAGPSGSGKSRLADLLHTEHGWPIVRLDDFYRDEDDPALPISAELGIADWDDPGSWNADAALGALEALVRTGATTTPVYDISTSRAVGSTQITARPDDLILTEGIFAAELIGPLRDRGLLHAAYVIARPRWVTFGLRLSRDLRERRKPPTVLVKRGLALLRDEPHVVDRQVELGGVPVGPRRARRLLGRSNPAPVTD